MISFFTCLIVHIGFWRLQKIKHDVVWLIAIFLMFPLGLTIVTAAEPFPWAATVTHFILSANYIAIYPAIQARSPSLVILTHLYYHPAGLTMSQCLQLFGEESLVDDRFQDLRNGKLIHDGKNEIKLTMKGHLLALFFLGYRKILGLPPGGG